MAAFLFYRIADLLLSNLGRLKPLAAVGVLFSWYAVDWTILYLYVSRTDFNAAAHTWRIVMVWHLIAWLALLLYSFRSVHTASHTQGNHAVMRMFWPAFTQLGWNLLSTLGLLLVALFITVHLNSQILFDTRYLATHEKYQLGHSLNRTEHLPGARVKILMVVMSSWTDGSVQKRKEFRETTLQLRPQQSANVSFTYRFVLGAAPAKHTTNNTMRMLIQQEYDAFGDVLIVPAGDQYETLSQKVYKSMVWANEHTFDYLLKTDEDVFVRLDTISSEFMAQHPMAHYWSGLSYWDMPPIRNNSNKNADLYYTLPTYPAYTSGILYMLSDDVIARIVSSGPRLFLKNEDQNVGVWLHPFGIRPILERRVQSVQVCEDDMIAKHFSGDFEQPDNLTRYDMLDNVKKGRSMCKGFKQEYCAICYPCDGKVSHWREWNFECDPSRGITLRIQYDKDSLHAKLEHSPRELKPLRESVLRGNATVYGDLDQEDVDDGWIIPTVLTLNECLVCEDVDGISQAFWLMWEHDMTQFHNRHFRALEMLFVQQPKAVVFIVSSTLPSGLFDSFVESGYVVHVLNSKDMTTYQWWVGIDTRWWTTQIPMWSRSKYFSYHLEAYMALIMAYKYGGTVATFDTLWINLPKGNTQFMGIDQAYMPPGVSTDWTLNNIAGGYVSLNVMRVLPRWRFLRHFMDESFNKWFDSTCMDCVLRQGITKFIKKQMDYLKKHGLQLVEQQKLYPYNEMQAHTLFQRDAQSNSVLKHLEQTAWAIHLHERLNSGVPVEKRSVIWRLFHRYGLFLAEAEKKVAGEHELIPNVKADVDIDLMTPARIELRGKKRISLDGPLIVFVRGSKLVAQTFPATVRANVTHGRLRLGESMETQRLEFKMDDATLGDVNRWLASLSYEPRTKEDTLDMSVTLDGQERHASLVISM